MTNPAPKGGLVPVSRRVMNLSHVLRQSARRFSSEIGLVWGEKVWTWSELDNRVDAMCVALADKGVGKGDRVLVQSSNCNQMFESMFVCFRLGAVWVPTNFRQSPAEVAYLAQSSGASVMICHSDFPDHVPTNHKSAPTIKTVISIGHSDWGESYDELVDAYVNVPFTVADVEHDDPCWFFYTSGTTGRPKAAVLTHGQMGFVITNHLCDLMPGTTAHDASIVVAPLSHGAGIHQLVNTARSVKSILPARPGFDGDEIWSLVEKWNVTNLFTVPTIVNMLVSDSAVDTYDRSSLRYLIYAGAPMYREDQKKALAKLGPVLVQYFGLGEVTGNITVLPPSLHSAEDGPDVKIGTCGFERTAMQVTIQNERGEQVATGETGEIAVCGPAVFAGYYNNPEANDKAFRNGWFLTGDLGHLDDEGFLYITGRASDMYISGGSNIYPREIEEKILTHPNITEVGIVGVPDPQWGEVGIAVCVTDSEVSEVELLTWMSDKITRYKLPKRVYFWDELPKSAYGKVTKKLLRAQLEERGLSWLPSKRKEPHHECQYHTDYRWPIRDWRRNH